MYRYNKNKAAWIFCLLFVMMVVVVTEPIVTYTDTSAQGLHLASEGFGL